MAIVITKNASPVVEECLLHFDPPFFISQLALRKSTKVQELQLFRGLNRIAPEHSRSTAWSPHVGFTPWRKDPKGVKIAQFEEILVRNWLTGAVGAVGASGVNGTHSETTAPSSY